MSSTDPLLGRSTRKRLLDRAKESLRLGIVRQQSVVETFNYHDPFSVSSSTRSLNWRTTKSDEDHRTDIATLLVFIVLSGGLIGLCASAIVTATEFAIAQRNSMVAYVVHQSHASWSLVVAFCAMSCFSVVTVVCSAAMVQYIAPYASGAGVSLVMAYLNGNNIPKLVQLRVLAVKMVGVVLSVASGLTVGPEGPMVHIGAAVAANVARLVSVLWEGAIHYSNAAVALLTQKTRSLQKSTSWQTVQRKLSSLPCTLFTTAQLRDMTSAGAAAGMAAAFGAPIGGVLFAVEEARSHWSKFLAWESLLMAALGCFVSSALNPSGFPGVLHLPIEPERIRNDEILSHLPAVVAVAAITGLMGAGFNKVRVPLMKRMKVFKKRDEKVQRLIEAALVSLLCATLMACLTVTVGSCRPTPDSWADLEHYAIKLHCPKGSHHDLATAFYADRVPTIRQIFTLDPNTTSSPLTSRGLILIGAGDSLMGVDDAMLSGDDALMGVDDAMSGNTTHPGIAITGRYSGGDMEYFAHLPFSLPCLLALCCTYFGMMPLCSGISVPAGMFMPSIMVGSSFGALFGLTLRLFTDSPYTSHPSVLAITGATAMLAAMFRTSVSVIVIILEGTRAWTYHFAVVTPVIIANAIAYVFGMHGMYEIDLENNRAVVYLSPDPPRALWGMPVTQVMSAPVVGFDAIERVTRILEVLQTTQHNGFAVFQRAGREQQLHALESGNNRLAGIILRSQLIVLLQNGVYCDEAGNGVGESGGDDSNGNETRLKLQMSNGLHDIAHRSSSKAQADFIKEYVLANYDQGGQESGNDLESEGSLSQERYLNLAAFVNPAMITLRAECDARHAYCTMMQMDLRHLFVVDVNNNCCGMVTRKDLRAAVQQPADSHFDS